MNRSLLLSLMVLVFSTAAFGQPVITQASNSASFASEDLPNGGLAQGSIATFLLTGLQLGGLVQPTEFPLQTELGGISVKITSGGMQYDAIPLTVVPVPSLGIDVVSALIPSATAVGAATVTITNSNIGQTTPPYNVEIVAHGPGIYAINQQGSGPGVFTNAVSPYNVNLVTATATPGGFWDTWLTGLGAMNGDETWPPVSGDFRVSPYNYDIKVYVGGVQAEIRYAGRSGCCAGLDQLQIVIPTGVTGCYVPVVVVVNGVPSNTLTISISETGGVCSDPYGLTEDDIAAAQSSGELRIGTISLDRTNLQFPNPIGTGVFDFTMDSGTATFEQYDASQIYSIQSATGLFTPGACIVYQAQETAGEEEEPEVSDPSELDPVEPTTYLDAGTVINLQNGNGNRTLDKISKGQYYGDLGGDGFGSLQPLFFIAGAHNIDNDNGGVDVGAFQKTANFPAPLDWTNRDDINSIASSQDLLIQWTGGEGTVVIFGASAEEDADVGAGFFCLENASAGQFDVPAWVINSMPPSALVEGFATGILAVGNFLDPQRFDAPGLDVGLITSSSLALKEVGYHITVPDPGDGNGNGNGGGEDFAISSTAFADGGAIPATFSFRGANQSPPLTFENVPAGTQSFLVIMEDLDSQVGGVFLPARNFLHWSLWDIPGNTTTLPQGVAGIGVSGTNDFGTQGYGGPDPLPGTPHTYRIRAFALSEASLAQYLTAGAQAVVVSNAVDAVLPFTGITLAEAEYTGTFVQ